MIPKQTTSKPFTDACVARQVECSFRRRGGEAGKTAGSCQSAPILEEVESSDVFNVSLIRGLGKKGTVSSVGADTAATRGIVSKSNVEPAACVAHVVLRESEGCSNLSDDPDEGADSIARAAAADEGTVLAAKETSTEQTKANGKVAVVQFI